jgi:hypothetical protein
MPVEDIFRLLLQYPPFLKKDVSMLLEGSTAENFFVVLSILVQLQQLFQNFSSL